jgi:hypothetical protein
MDQVFAARSVVEPLGRPIDSKAGHYGTFEHLPLAPILAFRALRIAAEHRVLPLGRSDRDPGGLADARRPRRAIGEMGLGSRFRPRLRRA